MLVTITTDASFHFEHNIGAYAFWAVSNNFRILKHGAIKQKIFSPDTAEFMCIINAIHCVIKEKGISKIIVNTDSMNVIHCVERNKSAMKKYKLNHLQSLYKVYEELIGNMPIEFRHVRAHTMKTDARSWVNEWCDSKAKESLWKEIHKKNAQ